MPPHTDISTHPTSSDDPANGARLRGLFNWPQRCSSLLLTHCRLSHIHFFNFKTVLSTTQDTEGKCHMSGDFHFLKSLLCRLTERGNDGVYSVNFLQPRAGREGVRERVRVRVCLCVCVCARTCMLFGSRSIYVSHSLLQILCPLPLTQSLKWNSSILKLSYSLSFFSYTSKLIPWKARTWILQTINSTFTADFLSSFTNCGR